MSEQNSALLDPALRAVMGPRIKDEATSQNAPAPKKEPANPKKSAEPQWEPVREHVWIDDLKQVVKKTAVLAAVCLWFFYLQQSKLMDSDTAYRAMIVCNLLAGVGIGKCFAKGGGKHA